MTGRFFKVFTAGFIGGALAFAGALTDAIANGTFGAEICSEVGRTCYLGFTQETLVAGTLAGAVSALVFWRAYVSPAPPAA